MRLGNIDYSRRMHNIFCDKCHSHTGRVLQLMGYAGFSDCWRACTPQAFVSDWFDLPGKLHKPSHGSKACLPHAQCAPAVHHITLLPPSPLVGWWGRQKRDVGPRVHRHASLGSC